MRQDIPRLIVTLPARSVEEARAEIGTARRSGADVAEIRLDRWSAVERERVGELFPTELPLLATLRSAAEGGEGPDDPDLRARILASATRSPFAWIDLEAARDGEPDARGSGPTPPGLFRSTHFPADTPLDRLLDALESPSPPGSVRKWVIPAATGPVLRDLVPAILRLPPGHRPVVLTVGGSGPVLRALGRRLGLPFVFASLPEPIRGGPARAVEPSQVPVDRLHRFFAGGDAAPLFALLGHPVARSFSPAIHDRWIASTRRSGLYVPLDVVSDEEFTLVLDRLAELGCTGVNVTHPQKATAFAHAGTRTRAAEECGVANCLTWRDGHWEGDNTDLGAMRRRLEELRSSGAWDGERVTVLGAGGAARASLAAARALGAVGELLARDRARGAALARTFDATLVDPRRATRASLLVHATNAGQETDNPLAFPLEDLLGPGSRLIDWVYAAVDPHVARAAERAGATYEGGERLLVYQAAASFANWWGEAPPSDAVATVLQEVGCAA
jgi:shikimate dehydrogenase